MGQIILNAENISKKFCRDLRRSLLYAVKDLAGELTLRSGSDKLRRDEFWALQDVSFQLLPGESLGLIGGNGAGKSTLLKIINGLIRPDTGAMRITGSIGALIALGTGFNPILTGRENIYINAAVLGLKRKEVDRSLDQIIDFAEIGDFIDAPVQSYSSGMQVRLGFSVAANLNPDLLLIDEVLSVGDASFRARCINRLDEYKKNGGSIIFVSHNTMAVEAVCDRVMWLDHGRVMDIGDPRKVIQKYEENSLEISRQAEARIRIGSKKAEEAHVAESNAKITSIETHDLWGNPKSHFDSGESLEVRLRYESCGDIVDPYFIIGIKKGSGDAAIAMMSMMWDGVRLGEIPRKSVVSCELQSPPLSPGTYRLFAGILSQASGQLGRKWYAPYSELGYFTITAETLAANFPGAPGPHLVSQMPPLMIEHSWKLDEHRKASPQLQASADVEK